MAIAIILLPALIAMAMLNFMPAQRVAYKIYIPCVMFIPVYLYKSFGGFLLSAPTLVAVMLGLAGIVRWRHTLRLTFLDVLIFLFACSAFYADAHLRAPMIGVYVMLQNLGTCLFPYLIGRTLIEQTDSRRNFAKSLVICLAIVAILSLYEYRMTSNLFQQAVERLSGMSSPWGRQMRWGFARIAGPYGHAIFAGMMFSTGLLLQIWLAGTQSWDSFKALRYFRVSRRAKIVTGAVCLGLFMTQSRGPWIGCGFGMIIASIGFAKDRRRAATYAIVGLILATAVTSIALDKYTSERAFSTKGGGDQDQQNAAYRRNLASIYEPLIMEGGLWGWGTPQISYQGTVGWVRGQTSIDNEYLRLGMAQGIFGLALFVLMLLAGIYRMIRMCATLRSKQDVTFAYCLLGTLLAFSFTLTTVSLGDPVLQIAFMIFGWTQSVRATGEETETLTQVSNQPFAFKRVFA